MQKYSTYLNKCLTGRAITPKIVYISSNANNEWLEPFCLSFAYNGGTDPHLQINSWNNTKNQGGRCICTEWHLMCIAQAHSLSSYFTLPLAWPNSLPYYVPMPRLQP